MPVAQRLQYLTSYGRDALTDIIDAPRRLTTKRKEDGSPTPDSHESQEATHAPTRTYRYRNLRGAHSIRLLRFLPNSGDGDIGCTIKEYDVLSESIPYIALSYVWGDATIRHPIFLDGKIAQVTSNLREALAHLKTVFPHSSFWIDAICINQHNPQERMHQVRQMRTIYSNAAEVVMWLGPEHEEIERLDSMIESHHDQCRFLNDPVEGCGLLLDQGVISAMQCLMQHPYWSRVWIIQEVVAAKNTRIMCGNTSLHWRHLTQFLLLISYRHFRFPYGVVFDQIQHHAHSFPMLRLRNWSQTSTDLAQALDWSASSLATDSRDKVYALLGLVNKGAGQLVSADYTCSSCNVYCFAIRAMAIDCDFDQRGFDFRSEVQRVKRSCLDKALQHEQASAVRRVRSIWWQSKKMRWDKMWEQGLNAENFKVAQLARVEISTARIDVELGRNFGRRRIRRRLARILQKEPHEMAT